MTIKRGLAGLLSVTCVMLSTQMTASANPFGNIGNIGNTINTINEVNATIDTFEQALNGSPHSILSLSQTLGLDSDAASVISAVESTQQVLQLYDIWTNGLSASELDVVSLLVTQLASDTDLSVETLATKAWFSQKPNSEQAQITSTFLQLQDMMEATGSNEGQFLNYATCLATGSTSCAQ